MVFGSHPSTTPRRGICERLPQISVRVLEKRGMLTEGSTLYDNWVGSFQTGLGAIDIKADHYQATISLTLYGEKREQTVDVVWTPIFRKHPHWSGYRKPYFECPVCSRRCEILYIVNSIACRSCHGLKYQSQKGAAWTAAKTAKRIRKRLGDSIGSVWSEIPPRPKGMRHSTYQRLKNELEQAQRMQFRHDTPPDQAWR